MFLKIKQEKQAQLLETCYQGQVRQSWMAPADNLSYTDIAIRSLCQHNTDKIQQ